MSDDDAKIAERMKKAIWNMEYAGWVEEADASRATLALIERLSAEDAALRAEVAEAEKDWSDLDDFMNRIDATISESLEKIGEFPGKPAGFPDRIDAACRLLESIPALRAEVERLKESHKAISRNDLLTLVDSLQVEVAANAAWVEQLQAENTALKAERNHQKVVLVRFAGILGDRLGEIERLKAGEKADDDGDPMDVAGTLEREENR